MPGPLLTAIENHAHGARHAHASLAVLAMFMLVEFAKRAEGERGKGEVEERTGEIIRCLPAQLLHKSLEGMVKADYERFLRCDPLSFMSFFFIVLHFVGAPLPSRMICRLL